MKAFLCTLLLGLGLAHLASAQGKIEVAFGKKLGDTFDPGETPNEWTRNEAAGNYPGYQRYRFTPTSPFKGLTDYFIDVSPTTHRIYAITATGGMANETEARRFVTLLDIILAEKYATDPPPPQPSDRRRIRVVNDPYDVASSRPIEQRESSRWVKATASGQPGIPRPAAVGQVTPPAPPYFSVSVVYADRKLSDLAAQEAEVIKNAQDEALKAQEDAKQRKLAAEQAKMRAEAEEARLKELVILKEEASKLDSSGL